MSAVGGKDIAMTTDNTSRNTADRMDVPFVGLAAFAHQPACPDWDKLNRADVAVLGIPIDTASSYRVGTRFAPMRPLGTLIARREGGESFRSSADVPPHGATSSRGVTTI